MACVDVNIEVLHRDAAISLSIDKKPALINIEPDVVGVGAISLSIDESPALINFQASVVSFGAKFEEVCKVESGRYMKVSPQEVQWIDVGEIITYDVSANVDWTVN